MSLCECGRRKISILRTGLSVTSRLATVCPPASTSTLTVFSASTAGTDNSTLWLPNLNWTALPSAPASRTTPATGSAYG